MEDVIVPFAVAAITPLGCAWVASRFVPPTNKWIYGSVIIGTAFLSWKYIVPRMLTSMGYPVPFEAESFAADSEGCSECLFQDEGHDREYIYGPMIYYYGSGGYRHIPNANFCYTCGAEIEKPQTGWVAESFEGESKFIEPLIRKGKIDLSRDYKGRYRRKLSIPLKKK